MAQQFAKYGDTIVAFVVLQSLSFIYALGHKGALRDAILRGWSQVMRILIYAGLGYLAVVAFCGYWEHALKASLERPPDIVLRATVAACVGRCTIVLATILLSRYALRLNKPRDTKVA